MKGSGTGRPLWRETRFCQAFLSFESENPFLTAESAARLSNSCEQIFQPRKVRHHRQKQIEPALALGLEGSLIGLIGGGALGVLIFYSAWAQTFDMKRVGEMPERNTVFDVDGKVYSRLAGANRLIVTLNEVAPAFIDALLAREDTRFF